MAIIRIETRLDQFIRDCKYWIKGFEAGAATTVGIVGYLALRKKCKELKKKAEEVKEEES